MNISNHASQRAQQRGIPLELIKLISQFGAMTNKPGNSFEIQVTRKMKSKIISELKSAIQIMDKITDKAILVSFDGTIITSYNINK